MSRIDELIQMLCPDGVSFASLSDVAVTVPGLTGKNKTDFSDGNARFASYRNIFANPSLDLQSPDFVKISKGERQNSVREGDVLITGSSESLDEVGMSSVVMEVPSEPIYLNSFCFILRLNESQLLLPAFSKHLFRSESVRKQIRGTASGVTRINISKPRFMKIRIPVPPLEVQQEIVRVLDQFTQLETELQADLEARRRQYEYYARELMAEFDDMPHRAIGEVLYPVKTARGVQRSKYGIGSTIPIIDQGQASIAGYTDDETLRVPAGEYIVFGDHTRAVKWVDFDFAPGADGIKVFRSAADCLIRYAYFAFKQLNIPNRGYNRHWTVARELLIPIPTLEQQRRVVDILDRFEALVDVLIAEFAGRRKQYEYYRDKLLTFEEAAA